jgi:hypothetical protein
LKTNLSLVILGISVLLNCYACQMPIRKNPWLQSRRKNTTSWHYMNTKVRPGVETSRYLMIHNLFIRGRGTSGLKCVEANLPEAGRVRKTVVVAWAVPTNGSVWNPEVILKILSKEKQCNRRKEALPAAKQWETECTRILTNQQFEFSKSWHLTGLKANGRNEKLHCYQACQSKQI